MSQRKMAYETIADSLRKAIETGSIPAGTVLLEGPIAAIFDSSRSPVNQALANLESEGWIRRFDGRGFLAGKTGEARRIKVSPDMLPLAAEEATTAKTFAWQSYYYDFEQTIILRAIFGSARINELALARFYGVGRTVAGDILNFASKTGIVVQDEKLRWHINPLDAGRFHDLYELRILLEPAALASAIRRIPAADLDVMRRRLAETTARFPDIAPAELDGIEEDLHVEVLRHGSNAEILEALKRTRCVLVAGKHMQRATHSEMPIDAFMHEHIEIMDAIAAGELTVAQTALVNHLETSRTKAKVRLKAYISSRPPADISYVID